MCVFQKHHYVRWKKRKNLNCRSSQWCRRSLHWLPRNFTYCLQVTKWFRSWRYFWNVWSTLCINLWSLGDLQELLSLWCLDLMLPTAGGRIYSNVALDITYDACYCCFMCLGYFCPGLWMASVFNHVAIQIHLLCLLLPSDLSYLSQCVLWRRWQTALISHTDIN